MNNFKWWLKQSFVYGVVAATGFGLMWDANDWGSARISWSFAGLSIVSLIVGVALYYRTKASIRR